MHKKSFGQHFLHDKGVIRHILEFVHPNGRHIVEVGPGDGALTHALVNMVGVQQMTLVEADTDLIPGLQEKFPGIEIQQGDAARLSFSPENPWIFVSNLPYNAAAAILTHVLKMENPPEECVVMVQREQAERIVAMPGEMSLLSLAVQLYASAKKCFHIKPGAFTPPPKVESTVLHIIPHANIDREVNEHVMQIARIGFAKKRKQLQKNLMDGGCGSREALATVFETCGITQTARAQELTLEQWKCLGEKLENR